MLTVLYTVVLGEGVQFLGVGVAPLCLSILL